VTIRPAGRSTALRWTADASVRTFSLYLVPERLEEVGLQMGIAPSQVELRDHFHVSDPILESIAERFREVVTGQRPKDSLYLQTIVQTLSVHLLREYSTASPSDEQEAGALSRSRLHRVQRYIWRHLADNLSLDDLADEVGISKYHFSRRFKKRTGQSPYQFVIYERVRAARQQIRETTQSLAQIALNTGFSSQSHFTRTFKQHVGVTPGQYRDAWR
jgi:AraC family transcriptional regulator